MLYPLFQLLFDNINRWFDTNLSSLNLNKTHYMQFVNKNSSQIDLNIRHKNEKIAKTCTTKFLGLIIENTLYWKTHIDNIVPKLSSATFAIRTVKPYLSLDSLKMIYYSYFHSIMTYGIIFWGNSYYSTTIFRLQKSIIRIIVGLRSRDSCTKYFKKLKILPPKSQYILSLLLFVISNKNYFKENSDIHNIDTRTKSNLHQPLANSSIYQKGTYYYGIKVFNNLPSQIKGLSANKNQFSCALESFLYFHSFYTLDEHFNYNK